MIERMANLTRSEAHNIDDIRLTSPTEIKQIVKKFKNRKTPGLDGIPNIVLKNQYNAYPKLTAWKEATILAIHKPGRDPTDNEQNSRKHNFQ